MTRSADGFEDFRELTFRPPREDDHATILGALAHWWGDDGGSEAARARTALVPRLFLQHFTATSVLVEHETTLAGFLIGLLSPTRPDEAYVHVVGVDPAYRRRGLAAELYQRFFDHARRHGRRTVRAITSPGNTTSVAFHRSLGFTLEPGPLLDGVPAQIDYSGPGQHRIAFTASVAAPSGAAGSPSADEGAGALAAVVSVRGATFTDLEAVLAFWWTAAENDRPRRAHARGSAARW